MNIDDHEVPHDVTHGMDIDWDDSSSVGITLPLYLPPQNPSLTSPFHPPLSESSDDSDSDALLGSPRKRRKCPTTLPNGFTVNHHMTLNPVQIQTHPGHHRGLGTVKVHA
jgi:hypothetical protein